jgi:hypothetical protein
MCATVEGRAQTLNDVTGKGWPAPITPGTSEPATPPRAASSDGGMVGGLDAVAAGA